MSEPTSIGHPKELLLPTDVEGFDSLAELALDMRSAWNHAADPVWRQLDPELWALTRNPWVVLQTVSREKLQDVLNDPAFRKTLDDLVRERRDAEGPRRTAAGPNESDARVAGLDRQAKPGVRAGSAAGGIGRPRPLFGKRRTGLESSPKSETRLSNSQPPKPQGPNPARRRLGPWRF